MTSSLYDSIGGIFAQNGLVFSVKVVRWNFSYSLINSEILIHHPFPADETSRVIYELLGECISWKLILINSQANKTNFHMKSFAPCLAFVMRLKAARNLETKVNGKNKILIHLLYLVDFIWKLSTINQELNGPSRSLNHFNRYKASFFTGYFYHSEFNTGLTISCCDQNKTTTL